MIARRHRRDLCLDIFTPRKRIQTISAVFFGLIVGLFLSYLVQIAIEPTLTFFLPESPPSGP